MSDDWRDTLGQAAVKFIRQSGRLVEWEEIISFAESYPLPPRDPSAPPPPAASEVARLTQENAVLRARLARAHSDIVDHMAQRSAFRSELARLDASNPLVTNVELRQRISAAGQRAFALTGGDWNIVKEVGAHFMEGLRKEGSSKGSGNDV